jgi:hypothetical protein
LPSQIAFEIKGFNRKCKQIIDGILLFKSWKNGENLIMRHPNREKILNQILGSYKK